MEGSLSLDRVHAPVLVEEVMEGLHCHAGGTYVDCTIGQGGHALRILHANAPDGLLVGIDRDSQALMAAMDRLHQFGDRLRLVHGNFHELKQQLRSVGISDVDGVVFDLGVSSAQLSSPERGFSFMVDGPLDMRMDRNVGPTAGDLLNRLSESDLANVIFQYGEERYARRIARALIRARAQHPLSTTTELVSLIKRAVPAAYRHGRIHYATRTFQALRIAVNGELDGLERVFRDAADALRPGGRLCIISFHSLEDRIAKHTLRALSQGSDPPIVVITKKPIVPSEMERRANPRARSAKLRVAERLVRRERGVPRDRACLGRLRAGGMK
jgi:16S rRNA (cytosine1402-N4)-methyltransferase